MDGGRADQAEQAAEAGDDAIQRAGRAAVRAHLLARLDQAGLQKPASVSLADHTALRARLVEQLDHMTPENLMTLAELVIDAACGPKRQHWPSEVIVRGMANALQPRPAARHRIVTSWLASVEGPVAEAGGWLVELFRFLDRHRRPPLAMDQRQMREEATEARRQRELVRSRIERGVASAEDLRWLERYSADERTARALVAAGSAVRAAQAERQKDTQGEGQRNDTGQ